MAETTVQTYEFPLETAIAEWLRQKQDTKSGSAKTNTAYQETLQSFRAFLFVLPGSPDLLSTPRDVARSASIWAASRHPEAKHTGPVADSTFNQRLAIVSSFYVFLLKTYRLQIENPIAGVPKRRVQPYAGAHGLDDSDIMDRLNQLETKSIQGKRDYALLALGVMTGRRASELVKLCWGDFQRERGRLVVTFHCKGGKILRDALDPDLEAVILDYLRAVHGDDLSQLPAEQPIWISFSDRNRGKQISTHTLNALCETYLGTTKIHTLRHSFAQAMERAGATLSEIQDRLGHENIATTARYLKALGSAENKHAAVLARRFGLRKVEK